MLRFLHLENDITTVIITLLQLEITQRTAAPDSYVFLSSVIHADRSLSSDSQRSSMNVNQGTVGSDPVILATAGYDHTVRFWQAHSGICTRTVQHQDSVSFLCPRNNTSVTGRFKSDSCPPMSQDGTKDFLLLSLEQLHVTSGRREICARNYNCKMSCKMWK